ncbi:MAG: hypothetical protein DRP06_01790 [Candidatus Aenigmatarchaeota archaeon]|nr:MAG: hypothetical protein DRP06_01790 [Candidatus Aenigmarchaeota archaeon]
MGIYNWDLGILYPEDVGFNHNISVVTDLYKKLEGTNTGDLDLYSLVPHSLVPHRVGRTNYIKNSQPIIEEAKKRNGIVKSRKRTHRSRGSVASK